MNDECMGEWKSECEKSKKHCQETEPNRYKMRNKCRLNPLIAK